MEGQVILLDGKTSLKDYGLFSRHENDVKDIITDSA